MDDAAEHFLRLVGSNRAQVDSELEKLMLFCWPTKLITAEDVDASCGDQASFDMDVLTSAVLDGDLDTVDQCIFDIEPITFAVQLLSLQGRHGIGLFNRIKLQRIPHIAIGGTAK